MKKQNIILIVILGIIFFSCSNTNMIMTSTNYPKLIISNDGKFKLTGQVKKVLDDENFENLSDIEVDIEICDGINLEKITLKTDSDGKYYFNILRPDIYRISIIAKTKISGFLSIDKNWHYSEIIFDNSIRLPVILYAKPIELINIKNGEEINSDKIIKWEKEKDAHYYNVEIIHKNNDNNSIQTSSRLTTNPEYSLKRRSLEKGKNTLCVKAYNQNQKIRISETINFTVK